MAYTIFCDEGVTFTAAELLNVHFAQVKDRRFLEAMERRGGDLYVITMSPAFSDSYQAACEARDTLLSGGRDPEYLCAGYQNGFFRRAGCGKTAARFPALRHGAGADADGDAGIYREPQHHWCSRPGGCPAGMQGSQPQGHSPLCRLWTQTVDGGRAGRTVPCPRTQSAQRYGGACRYGPAAVCTAEGKAKALRDYVFRLSGTGKGAGAAAEKGLRLPGAGDCTGRSGGIQIHGNGNVDGCLLSFDRNEKRGLQALEASFLSGKFRTEIGAVLPDNPGTAGDIG